MDDGGVHALDAGHVHRALVCRRVTVEGTRSEFDRIDVDWLGRA